MGKLSKFICVAVAGATCDGRTIEENWITEMAETYNPATYTARINMEHIRGFSADPPFCAYGDVKAAEARVIDLSIGGKTEKRRALFVQFDALDNLVTLNAKGQKLFTSIEVNPNFAGTGKAYLQGLAVTDSPASLGTEMLEFAGKLGDKSPLASRKVDKGNYFSAASELKIEFEDPAPAQPEHAGLFAAATAFFKQFTEGKGDGGGEKKDDPAPPAPPAPAPSQAPGNDSFGALSQGLEKMLEGFTAFTTSVTADVASIRTELGTVKASIENTDGGAPKRPAASGAGNFTATDC